MAGRLQGDQGARPGREGWAVVLLPAGRAQGEGLLEEELGMGVLLRAGDCFWPPGCWEGGREPGILVMGLEGVTGWGAGPEYARAWFLDCSAGPPRDWAPAWRPPKTSCQPF